MKKLTAVIPMMFAVLLSGCTSELEQSCEDFLAAECAKERLAFTAEVKAVYPDGEISFTLSCAEEDGGVTVEVLSPELISGIKAHIEEGSSQLMYDGVILDTGELDKWGLTPVSAMPKLIAAVRHGALSAFSREGDGVTMDIAVDDHITVSLTLDENMTPVYAELASDGETVLFCNITAWK